MKKIYQKIPSPEKKNVQNFDTYQYQSRIID